MNIHVRRAGPDDAAHAEAAAALIAQAAREHDVAARDAAFIAAQIAAGKAVLALRGGELMGFGYYRDYQGGRFVSHSGLVVHPDARRRGVGRRLKTALLEASRERFPDAATMSLTNSPQVRALNLSLGYEPVPHDQLTTDPAFWAGCRGCRSYRDAQRRGERCCCEAMILRPPPRGHPRSKPR